MNKRSLLFIIFCTLFISSSQAKSINDIKITNPKDIETFLLDNNYKYVLDEKEEYWESPDEFYLTKSGDCEDFAMFTNYLLKHKLHLFSKVFLIHWKGKEEGHALTVFKYKKQYYLFDLQYIIQTQQTNIIKAILNVYPDIDNIFELRYRKYGSLKNKDVFNMLKCYWSDDEEVSNKSFR